MLELSSIQQRPLSISIRVLHVGLKYGLLKKPSISKVGERWDQHNWNSSYHNDQATRGTAFYLRGLIGLR